MTLVMLLWQLIQKNIMNILKVKTAIKNTKELKKAHQVWSMKIMQRELNL